MDTLPLPGSSPSSERDAQGNKIPIEINKILALQSMQNEDAPLCAVPMFDPETGELLRDRKTGKMRMSQNSLH